MAAEIAAVVGNHQGELVLRDCLESLRAQTRAPRSIVVVDGASTDRGPELAEELGAHVLRAPNRGLGFLYNLGARATECDYVLFSNNDVAYEPDCLAHLADALDADAQRFAADPTQLDWSNGRVIHARTSLARGRLWREYLPGLHLDDAEHADSIVPTVSAHGAAMLVRRNLLLELGGFDETFFMEWEDLDLCWRAWTRGWSSVYVPQARLRHRVGAVTSEGMRARRSASSHHNLLRFALKCLPRAAAARVVVGELLRLPRHPRAITLAFLRLASDLRNVRRARRELGPRSELLDWMLAGQPV
jgi:N-acetylglucosaminyl-diphospho-decaprenol L-rhamnosyltransferase